MAREIPIGLINPRGTYFKSWFLWWVVSLCTSATHTLFLQLPTNMQHRRLSAFTSVPFSSEESATKHFTRLRNSPTYFVQMTRTDLDILLERTVQTACSDEEFLSLLDQLCSFCMHRVKVHHADSASTEDTTVWPSHYTTYVIRSVTTRSQDGPFNLRVVGILSKHHVCWWDDTCDRTYSKVNLYHTRKNI